MAGQKAASTPADLATQWARIRSRLRAEVGDATYASWFKQIDLIGIGDGHVMLAVPTRFIRSWIASHFAERLLVLWQSEDPAIIKVDVLVRVSSSPAPDASQNAAAPTPPAPNNAAPAFITGAPSTTPSTTPMGQPRSRAAASMDAVARRPVPAVRPRSAQAISPMKPGETRTIAEASNFNDGVGAPIDARLNFDSFIVGKSNELAYAAARRVAEATDVAFNPLYLYGGVGLGKTHLMHAIANEIRRADPTRKVLYLSAEMFMFRFVRALRFKDTMAFKEQFRQVDVLMVDDVQFISGKETTQEEFFHTFNALVDNNRQVIISADRSPSDLEGIEERIRSRLGWGLVCDIHPTDFELRLGILQAKAEEIVARTPSVNVPHDVLELLAGRIVSNVRELEGALKRVVAYGTLVQRVINVDMAQDVLRDLLRSHERRVTIEEIQRRVAEYFSVRLSDLLSARRARAIARPRQVAMYLSKQLTTRSLPEIGRKFGGRDHTTVIHAVRKIDELCKQDASMEEDVDLLRRMLENGAEH
ncbi:MAG: chromosomal replication initiator protein DnaA [Parvibaculaceae bacterium]|nr:chromosomal replication initiator protein DnaA [Parvibaculaceae bacterium]